jgi:hypothetical protein
MIFRRIRTLTDRFLQPPPAANISESELYYERRLNEQSALIDSAAIVPSDARLDFVKWGSWLQGGATVPYTSTNAAVETMARAIQRWKTEYLPARRNYIYNTQIVGKGGEIPLPQTGGPTYTWTPLVTMGAAAQVSFPPMAISARSGRATHCTSLSLRQAGSAARQVWATTAAPAIKRSLART